MIAVVEQNQLMKNMASRQRAATAETHFPFFILFLLLFLSCAATAEFNLRFVVKVACVFFLLRYDAEDKGNAKDVQRLSIDQG